MTLHGRNADLNRFLLKRFSWGDMSDGMVDEVLWMGRYEEQTTVQEDRHVEIRERTIGVAKQYLKGRLCVRSDLVQPSPILKSKAKGDV